MVSPTLISEKRLISGGATTKTTSPLGFFSVTRRVALSIAVTVAVAVMVSPGTVLIWAPAIAGKITAAASTPARIRFIARRSPVMVVKFNCSS
jgi:hypothetical protein